MAAAARLSTIVMSARGSMAQAIILFEAALGLGIATGPLLGGQLGEISWRGPFFGVAVLMTIALGATAWLLPATPPTTARTALADPLRALRHRGLLTVALTALFYNVGFFILLAVTPFPLGMGAMQIGWIFFGWGLLLAVSSVWVAPALQRRFGNVPVVVGSLGLFALDLAVMATFTAHPPVLVVCVIVAGAFLGINNTVITETVMESAPVPRPVASAAYSFVRFGGGAVAPYAGGKLYEHVSPGSPFWVGAAAVALGAAILWAGRSHLAHETPSELDEAEAIVVGDAG